MFDHLNPLRIRFGITRTQVRDVVTGKKNMSLAISEPTAGYVVALVFSSRPNTLLETQTRKQIRRRESSNDS